MNSSFRQILPLLLRPYETLQISDILKIKEVYNLLGRDGFENNLLCEKQTRCYASLVLANVSDDMKYWEEVHLTYVHRNSAILCLVEKCFEQFCKLGGKTLSVYENFGAVLSSGVSLGCFASGDVDFTVSEAELELVKRVFRDNGFKLEARKDHASVSNTLLLPYYNGEALEGRGYWFNIMLKPVARSFMIDQTKTHERLRLLQTSQLERYNGGPVRLLNPTAMVYFNALHFASEHYYSASPGMALCCDIDRVVRNRQVDWEELRRWSDEDNCGLRVQIALDICRYFLLTPIPDNVFTNRSKYYCRLWQCLVNEEQHLLNPQIGYISRLRTELLSDDKPFLRSLISRLF